MKTKPFTEEEITDITQTLVAKKVKQSEIDLVVSTLSKYKLTGKTHPTKGLKIALKRAGNKLGVSYEINLDESAKTARLSNFTGGETDLTKLVEIAHKFGFSLNGF